MIIITLYGNFTIYSSSNNNDLDNNLSHFLQSNTMELLDCCLLPQLKFLDLSDNKLASIHGLQHCKQLLELNIAENRVARIGT